ncbi:TlpA family protein disulfide reductase [Clostridium gasigenes]|uniref:TlpA disulfide reductase family protein n=1 Tax=Clostridium gasigenes TaxID=94869 RepID=UPI00143860C3|nr:TlpA disulfide reductase family protein [Clostridium gasigenes]NKF08454.1 TlpA family protein disulfide reductase [Clostridium gasigenes]QSW21270.1 TlpA family protein disulfide reductase [Clostridium gasigenes]
MKKSLFILAITILFGVSLYTVINYNKNKTINLGNSNNISLPVETDDNKIDMENSQTTTKEKAIDFKLKDLNGKDVSLNDFKGKNVLLNFWATWCPPCKAEMPDIEKLYQENKNSDLVILAVNLGEDKQTVKSFIEKNKYNFDILLDSDQDVAIKYNIVSIPTSFFIDKEGNIVSKKIGAMTLEEMKSYINLLNN